jgi:Sec7-like guanine-nucleotide exchange factor
MENCLVLIPSLFYVLSLSLSDACYILSFAIIMLNTSLHNPNVKHKVRERERKERVGGWEAGKR